MLKWEIKNGDDKLKEEIERMKSTFDKWYENSGWVKTCSKEKMLNENSPLEHVYYKMTKTFEEVMKKVEKTEELEVEEHLKNNFSYKEGRLRGYADGLIMATSILSRLEKKAKNKRR